MRDAPAPAIPPRSPLRSPQHQSFQHKSPKPVPNEKAATTEDLKDSEESFVSADEAPTERIVGRPETQETELPTQEEDSRAQASHVTEESNRVPSHPFSVSTETDADMQEAAEHVERTSPIRLQDTSRRSSPSDTSSPERPAIRKKSSLNLASLPPRDPLTTKRSLGTATMQGPMRDSTRGFSTVRDSYLQRTKQSQGPEPSQGMKENELAKAEGIDADDHRDETAPQASVSPTLHSKTSTQRLHERITMLGKSNASRPSKSISATMAHVQATSRITDHAGPSNLTTKNAEAQDDDWIAPITQHQIDEDRRGADRTDTQERDAHEKSTASSGKIAYPDLAPTAVESTTPSGSPSKWTGEGPLSASKAKFQSFLRSAKGMFASSAAASAQAKMDVMAPSPSRNKPTGQLNLAPEVMDTDLAEPILPKPVARKRSASEGLSRDEREVAREEPPAKRRSSKRVSEQRTREKEADDKPFTQESEQESDLDLGLQAQQDQSQDREKREISKPPLKKPLRPADQQGKIADQKRPKQIAKPIAASKAKPGQISVMVPSMRPQLGASTASFKSSTQQAPSQALPTTRPTLTKKGSDTSLRSASSQSMRAGPANTKLKALESARRKKEQDEREQHRKEEQKKALEKRKAEKAEEERQAIERKAAEQKKEAEARAAAQKRAAEQEKAEKQRREEQLRAQADATRPRPANDFMAKSQTERLPAASKIEKLPARPESRGQDSSRPLIPHVNPAKPVKRYFNPDAEDQRQPSQGPAPAAFAPIGVQKKPKVSEEFELRTQQQPLSRPPMGAPMRPSFAKKTELPPKFQHGFMSSSSTQNNPSMLKSAVNTSAAQQMQGYPKTPAGMSDMAKFTNARIPFAEAPNPPGPQQPQLPARGNPQKTPASATTHKSSPGFPNGDNISLPEIATDSEDEDSDDAFEAPGWTNSPELRQLLEQQQLVDPMRVFGPIAPLSMDEVFKGVGKDRLKRFRDRTSSANWAGADRLTEEERRKDREARERLEKDGGWTYEASMRFEKEKERERERAGRA